MDSKLLELIDNRPSAIRNSFLITIVRILSWFTGLFLFIVGVSILIHNFVYDGFLAHLNILAELETSTTSIIGIESIILSTLFFFVVRLCKMLIKRNLFLIELDLWRYDWEKIQIDTNSKNNR